MKNLYILIKFAVFIKALHQIAYFLYLYQLKEYRLDRMKEHLKRVYSSSLKIFYYNTIGSPINIKMLPRITIKSTIIITLAIIFCFIFIKTTPFPLSISAIFISPFFVLIAQFIIFPFELIIKKLIFIYASSKILALKKRGLVVIGITGSYGKSSTKHFVNSVLSEQYNVCSTPKSINTPVGVSIVAIKKLMPKHSFFIVEMGAYKKGEIAEIAHITHPDIGIITGISNQHIALFGSQNSVIEAKSELLKALPKGNTAYINASSDFLPVKSSYKHLKVVFYDTGDIIKKENKKYLSSTNLPEFLKLNCVPALLIAKKFKVPDEKIIKAFSTLSPPEKTMKKYTGKNGAIIIDDSFSSNEKGVISAIQYASSLNPKKLIVFLYPLIELGNETESSYKKICDSISHKNTEIYTFSENEYFMLKKFCCQKCNVKYNKNTEEICKKISTSLNKNTVFLIEGRVPKKIIDFISN